MKAQLLVLWLLPATIIVAVPRGRAEDASAARQAELLKRFDTNGDGVLSDQEKEAAKAELKSERAKNHGAKRGWARLDTDGDGLLSPAELTAALERIRPGRKHHNPLAEFILKDADTNKDGVISKSEIAAAVASFVRNNDKDGDGKLSRREMAPVHRQIRELREQDSKKNRS